MSQGIGDQLETNLKYITKASASRNLMSYTQVITEFKIDPWTEVFANCRKLDIEPRLQEF